MDELDFEPEQSVLDDPDLYALVLRGQVEATFTCAELQDLLRAARSVQRAEGERQKKSPATGIGAALSRVLGGPSSEIEVLVLKLQAVNERAARRHGFGPLRDALRRFFRPEAE